MPRSRLFHIKRQSLPGSAPGTMIAPESAPPPVIDMFAYGSTGAAEHADLSLSDISAARANHDVVWVNVTGVGDADLISELGDIFDLHELAMEDVLNTHQRPKVEEFTDHIFVVTRLVQVRDAATTEQVAIFLGSNYLLTFVEGPSGSFEAVRERLQRGKGRIRNLGPDYLCYALIDAAIDEYFPLLERIGESLETLEDELVSQPNSQHISQLHEMKRDFLALRRTMWPHREMVHALQRDDIDLITDDTRIYLRDIYDHTMQQMEILETYREIATGLVDVYISSVSAKMNEIMKVLTIIATIFIPLSFVAGLYGMNFDRSVSLWNMPELGLRFGYPIVLLLMFGIAAGLLAYFRHIGWIGSHSRPKRPGRE